MTSDLRDKIQSSWTRDMSVESTVQRPHNPPNDSQPGQPEVGVGKNDLRNIITGKKPPQKLVVFTKKPRPNPSQEINNQAKEITEKNTSFNKLEKIKKSAVHYAWEN